MKSKIEYECRNYNENKTNGDKKTLENFTNDFRDSFRIFKAVLLKEHNTLDALDFHKAEFYCKEIELQQKWHKKSDEVANDENMRKNTLKFKETIDFCLLNFYRKLCEHHTDFLRVFNNLILLIALYVAFFCIGKFELLIKDSDTINSSESPIQIHIDFVNMIVECIRPYKMYVYVVCSIASVIAIICIFSTFIKQIFTIKTIIKKNCELFIKDVVDFVVSILFILFALAMVDGYAPKGQFHLYDTYLFCFFIMFYLWLVCIRTLFLRYLFICLAYILVFVGIGISVTLINPLIGKLVDDSIKINNSSLLSITFAYTILMALVLFSLQKTARKNSIIPS